jgi:cell pole-organizing protein PopZ
MKPYQNATPDGSNGANDYSNWNYNVSTKYTAIKEGQNKITAKLSCLQTGTSGTNLANITGPSTNLVKWNSVNVTGVSTSGNNQTISNSTIHQQQKQDRFKAGGNATASSNGTLITTTHDKTSKSNYNGAKSLSVSVKTSQSIVNGRGTSTVTALANDAATGKKVENATVKLKITFTSNGTSKEIVGHNGEVAYSAIIKPTPNNNSNMSFRATVEASAPGYISTSKTTTSSSSSFASKSTETSSSSHERSIENLTQNILKDVQKRLKENGINATLG